jgi:hypothetical protein
LLNGSTDIIYRGILFREISSGFLIRNQRPVIINSCVIGFEFFVMDRFPVGISVQR